MTGYQNLNNFERAVIVETREIGHSISQAPMKFGSLRRIVSQVNNEYQHTVKYQISDIFAASRRSRKNGTVELTRIF